MIATRDPQRQKSYYSNTVPSDEAKMTFFSSLDVSWTECFARDATCATVIALSFDLAVVDCSLEY
jgi:hypothetical protein